MTIQRYHHTWHRPGSLTGWPSGPLLFAAGMIGACNNALSAEARTFTLAAEWSVTCNSSSLAAEIVAASKDGLELVYTDSPGRLLGFVDISDPGAPSSGGVLALDGEPTSVVVSGSYALVGVNTSESFTDPSGHIAIVDIAGRELNGQCDVGGQPDSVALSADGAFVAVAIENERDEDVSDGALPQFPAGHVTIFDLGRDGKPTNCDNARLVTLTGLAAVSGDDPEPEYIAINGLNVAAVTLQENNHIALIDLASGDITGHFSAATVDLKNVDLTDDGSVSLTEALPNVRREPDGVTWLDDDHLVTANEGDYKGGSRSFTIFDRLGAIIWDSGSDTERLAAEAGTYADERSPSKGTEPETVAVGKFDGNSFIFVALERANSVAVYQAKDGKPEFYQMLATGIAPEGILPLPARGLVVVANEADPGEGLASTISLFELDP